MKNGTGKAIIPQASSGVPPHIYKHAVRPLHIHLSAVFVSDTAIGEGQINVSDAHPPHSQVSRLVSEGNRPSLGTADGTDAKPSVSFTSSAAEV